MDVGVLTGLPVGQYVVTAKVQFDALVDSGSTQVACTLTLSDAANLSGPFVDASAASLSLERSATLPFSAVGDLPSGGTAVLNCTGNNVTATNVKLTAIQVGSLTVLR